MTYNKHLYIIPLIEVIKDLQDEDYQKRIWVLGEGPECDSFGEAINSFFDYYDSLKDELQSEKYGLRKKEIAMIHSLAEKLEQYCEITPTSPDVKKVFKDPKWQEIRNFAKQVYLELTKPIV